jgi:hypothetical protein
MTRVAEDLPYVPDADAQLGAGLIGLWYFRTKWLPTSYQPAGTTTVKPGYVPLPRTCAVCGPAASGVTPGPNVGEEAGAEAGVGVEPFAGVDVRSAAAPEQATTTNTMPIVASH